VSSSTTVDGLVSGMNTTQVIAQLMQLAAQPQTDLKNQVAQENTVISAYQSVKAESASTRARTGIIRKRMGVRTSFPWQHSYSRHMPNF